MYLLGNIESYESKKALISETSKFIRISFVEDTSTRFFHSLESFVSKQFHKGIEFFFLFFFFFGFIWSQKFHKVVQSTVEKSLNTYPGLEKCSNFSI